MLLDGDVTAPIWLPTPMLAVESRSGEDMDQKMGCNVDAFLREKAVNDEKANSNAHKSLRLPTFLSVDPSFRKKNDELYKPYEFGCLPYPRLTPPLPPTTC